MEKNEKILIENSEKDGIVCLKIRIPKILEIADEYTKKQLTKKEKSGQTPDKLPTKSGVTPEKIPLDKIRLGKIKKESPIKKDGIDMQKNQLTEKRAEECKVEKEGEEEKKESSCPKLKFTDEDMDLVHELEALIKDIDPEHKFSGGQRKEKWANTFRLMRERDDRTMEDIQAIMDFAFHDSFWSAVIQSAESLRKNYNQLRAKMLKGKSNKEKPKRPKPVYINHSACTITL